MFESNQRIKAQIEENIMWYEHFPNDIMISSGKYVKKSRDGSEVKNSRMHNGTITRLITRACRRREPCVYKCIAVLCVL